MTTKNKQLATGIITLVVLVLLLVSINLIYLQTGSTEDKIVIGAVLPLSGDFAFIGEEIMRGMELAKEDFQLEGTDLEIIYEDDQSLVLSAAVSAANKLTNIDNVDVAITALTEEARPIAPIFNSEETPLVVVWDSTQFIQESGDYIFSTGFSTERAGEKMAIFAYNDLDLIKIAIVSHSDPWSETISKSFKEKFEALGGDIIYEEKHNPTEQDYRTTIAKIKETNAGGVYVPLVPPYSGNFLIQAKQLGLNAQLLSADALIQDVIDIAGAAAEDIYYTNIFTEDSEMLTAKYAEKYGTDPLDVAMVSFGYDGISTIVKAHLSNSEDLRQGLENVIGPSRTLSRTERIYQVIDGKGVLVEF